MLLTNSIKTWLGMDIDPQGTLSFSTCIGGLPADPIAVYGGTDLNQDPLVNAFPFGNLPATCSAPYPPNIFFGEYTDAPSYTACPGTTGASGPSGPTGAAYTLFNGDSQSAFAVQSMIEPLLGVSLVMSGPTGTFGATGSIIVASNVLAGGSVTIDPCINYLSPWVSLVGMADLSVIGTFALKLSQQSQAMCEAEALTTPNFCFANGQVNEPNIDNPTGPCTNPTGSLKIKADPSVVSGAALYIVWTYTANLPPVGTTLEALVPDPNNTAWTIQQYGFNTVPFWLPVMVTDTSTLTPTGVLIYEDANVPYASSYDVTTNTIVNTASLTNAENVFISSVNNNVLNIGMVTFPPSSTSRGMSSTEKILIGVSIGVVVLIVIIILIVAVMRRKKS